MLGVVVLVYPLERRYVQRPTAGTCVVLVYPLERPMPFSASSSLEQLPSLGSKAWPS